MSEGFTPYKLESERSDTKDIFTIRLNAEERLMLNNAKKFIEQPKDSTCMKQLAVIGYNVLHDPIMGKVIGTLFKNKRNNKRSGVIDFE